MTGTGLTIEKNILIDAPALVVWSVLTEPDQIAKSFWPVELDLRPGGSGRFSFPEEEHGGFVYETVDPPHELTYRWAYPDGAAPGPGNSVLVRFTLTPEGEEQTRLSVQESGLEQLDWSPADKQKYVEGHRHGWSEHLARLADLAAQRSR